MKKIFLLLAAVGVVVLIKFALSHAGVMVTKNSAWARATPPGVTTAAIYLTLMNHSGSDLQLTAATSGISDRIELHTHKTEHGMMNMEQVQFINLPDDSMTALKPHAEHLMVFNLKKPLKVGEQVSVELIFDNGETLAVEVPVYKEAPKTDGMDKKHDH